MKTIVVDNGDCNCNYCQKKKLQNSVGFFSDRASAVDPRPSEKNSPPVPGNSAEGAEKCGGCLQPVAEPAPPGCARHEAAVWRHDAARHVWALRTDDHRAPDRGVTCQALQLGDYRVHREAAERFGVPLPEEAYRGCEQFPSHVEPPVGLLPAPAITTLRARVMTDYSGVISIQCPRPDCGEPVEFPGSDWPELGELLALLRVHEASKHVVVLDSGALDKLREALQVHVNREQR